MAKYFVSMSRIYAWDTQPEYAVSGSDLSGSYLNGYIEKETGSVYYNKQSGSMFLYDGSVFKAVGPGTSGTSGTAGTAGTSGESGTSGTSGSSGTAGNSGTSGTSGDSGTSGTSGTSGQNGTSGTSGGKGDGGTAGTAGSSGTSGVTGDLYSTTSNTVQSIGTGAKSFVLVDTDLAYIPGQPVVAAFDGSNYMTGTVTSYNTGTNTLVINSTSAVGSGTYSSWSVAPGGVPGLDGSSGTSGTSGTSGADGPTGTSGTSGTSGQGEPGTAGTSGTSGTSGADGPTGTSGTSGADGPTGTSGSSGTSGTVGAISGSINIVLYNGGTDLTTGIKDHPVMIPYSASAKGWDIMAFDSSNTLVSTSTVVDILSDTLANLPLSGTDSIAGTEKPTLSGQSTNQDTNLTTWSQLVPGNYLQAEIESINAGVAKVVVNIKVERI